MSDLLMRRSAVISECLTWRYEARRIWDERLPMLAVCMLNPSTADHEKEDNTLRELIHFATMWGYGGLIIVNLYAFRSPKPSVMFAAEDHAQGPENDKYRAAAVAYAKANGGRMLVAWGNDGNEKARWFSRYVDAQGVRMICLGTTQSGAPKHPMARGKHRIPRDQQPVDWKEPAF